MDWEEDHCRFFCLIRAKGCRSNFASGQDGLPQWLDIQQIQLHSTLASPPCQVVFAILLVKFDICKLLSLENFKHQKNFRFRKLDIPVCSSNVSALANKLYLKNQVNKKLFLFSFVSESHSMGCSMVIYETGTGSKDQIWKNYYQS